MPTQNVNVEVLRSLHRIHRQLSDLRSRLARGPRQIAAGENHVKSQEAKLEEAEEKLKRMRVATDAKQVQLKGGEAKIADLQTKLNTASSNKEYQAIKDQIAAQNMTNSVLDDEILEGWEKIEQFEPQVQQIKKGLQTTRETQAKVAAEVQQKQPQISDDIERLQQELAECEGSLPAEIRELYKRLVRSRGEDALAPVLGQVCQGCQTQVTINMLAQLKLSQPVFCRSCGRMLYMPEESAEAE